MQHLLVFVVGPAGSGKSTFTASFRDWLSSQNVPVSTVNMDPAVEFLEYDPDIDIREYVFVRDVLEKYNLGPNGAIIASLDLAVEHLGEVTRLIYDLPEGYVLIDTPGQMEIFAYRQSGMYIIRELCTADRKCSAVFLVDATISMEPYDFLSQVFLSSSVYYRFRIPLLTLINKIDLLDLKEREKLERWISERDALETSFETVHVMDKEFTRKIVRLLSEFMDVVPFIPVSSRQNQNFEEVFFYLQQVYMGGEDFEKEEYEV
ncbi:MAG: ATP/GTP-binding protein [Thermofilum sp.]|jgi:GTPase SAR1 family protein|nr:ATP/GTP-binding protein [Thermofilum sp.]